VIGLGGATMGTRWSARLACDPAVAKAAEVAITAALATVVAQMSGWEEESELSRFNRRPAGRWQALSPEFATVIAAALHWAEASSGAFDPTAGALVDLWGFGPAPVAALPDSAAIAAARRSVGWQRLGWDPAGRRLCRDGDLTLDLSGIAKGFAVDLAAAAVRRLGIADFLIEVGGELRGEGVKPGGEPWWVDLEIPPGLATDPLRIALHGCAVATSGDYRRFHITNGNRLAHSIDPRTGAPVANDLAAVSVIAADCMTADALATTLIVLGPEAGPAFAAARGVAALFVRRVGAGEEIVTPALAAMLA